MNWRLMDCKCRYKTICKLIDLDSVTCRLGIGSRYCRKYRKITGDFEGALLECFGPAHKVDGKLCVIILKTQFTQGLKKLLLKRKYVVTYGILDEAQAIFVVLKGRRGSA